MSPKMKAFEIVKKYIDIQNDSDTNSIIYFLYAKDFATICVKEIILAIDENTLSLSANLSRKYWNEVKIEIEKL